MIIMKVQPLFNTRNTEQTIIMLFFVMARLKLCSTFFNTIHTTEYHCAARWSTLQVQKQLLAFSLILLAGRAWKIFMLKVPHDYLHRVRAIHQLSSNTKVNIIDPQFSFEYLQVQLSRAQPNW